MPIPTQFALQPKFALQQPTPQRRGGDQQQDKGTFSSLSNESNLYYTVPSIYEQRDTTDRLSCNKFSLWVFFCVENTGDYVL